MCVCVWGSCARRPVGRWERRSCPDELCSHRRLPAESWGAGQAEAGALPWALGASLPCPGTGLTGCLPAEGQGRLQAVLSWNRAW